MNKIETFKLHISNNKRLYIEFLGLMFISFIGGLLVELLFQNPFALRPFLIFLNCLVHFLILLFLCAITGRFSWGLRLYAPLMAFIGTANYLVIAFRSSPLVPWDIYSAGTAFSVVDNYAFPFQVNYLVSMLGFVLIFASSFFFKSRFSRVRRRFTAFGMTFLGLFALVFGLRHDEAPRMFGLDTTLISTSYMSLKNGFLVNFIHCTKYMTVDTPDNYNTVKVKALLEEYSDYPVESTGIGLDEGVKPDIVVVMNESFSDLQMLNEFTTNMPYMEYYHSLKDNVQKGTLYSSVVGGNTASAEFEFLSGLSMGFLPAGSVAYIQYIREAMPTLVSQVEAQGYETLAMHPYFVSGWNRKAIYNHFGFDRMKFIQEFEHQHKLREFISDKALFDEILMELENQEASEAPLFMFTISMQNHGGYSDIHDNFTPEVEITSQDTNVEVQQYLSLIRETDKELEPFLKALEERERPTLLLFFGDHQPNNYTVRPLIEGMNRDEEQEKRRLSNYMFWANYPIKEALDVETSINFLGTQLLQAANLPLDGWHRFLSATQEQYPVMNDLYYYLADGTRESMAKVNKPDILNAYEILQYDLLFGNVQKSQ